MAFLFILTAQSLLMFLLFSLIDMVKSYFQDVKNNVSNTLNSIMYIIFIIVSILLCGTLLYTLIFITNQYGFLITVFNILILSFIYFIISIFF